jgi:hypothetical protein
MIHYLANFTIGLLLSIITENIYDNIYYEWKQPDPLLRNNPIIPFGGPILNYNWRKRQVLSYIGLIYLIISNFMNYLYQFVYPANNGIFFGGMILIINSLLQNWEKQMNIFQIILLGFVILMLISLNVI